jgi:hypothetical protein
MSKDFRPSPQACATAQVLPVEQVVAQAVVGPEDA